MLLGSVFALVPKGDRFQTFKHWQLSKTKEFSKCIQVAYSG